MEKSPSLQANRSSISQQIPRVVWNTEIHYRFDKISPRVLILSQINPLHALQTHLRKIRFNIILRPSYRYFKWSVSLSFDVLLTVHLGIFIVVINQLDAQNLFYNKFISCLYMFRALCAHCQEVKNVLYSLWYQHTCRWPSGAQVERGLSQPVHRTATYRV